MAITWRIPDACGYVLRGSDDKTVRTSLLYHFPVFRRQDFPLLFGCSGGFNSLILRKIRLIR